MKAKPRLEDIAAEAGVSAATVSRVFNRPDIVSERTRALVMNATRRLGLGTPSLQTIGLIVPDASNPFFSQLIYHFERELARHGALLVSASADGRIDREIDLIERFRGMKVEGILYTPTRSGSEAILELVSRGDIPVLAFDRQAEVGNLDCVTTAVRSTTQTLVDYLVNLGHRRFGYIRGAEATTTGEDRFEAFIHALARNDLELLEEHCFQGNYQFAAGRDSAEVLLQLPVDSRPTAMVAANDLMAIGFIQRVHEGGLRVPEHISVAGFDGIEFGSWYSPSLTTIVQPVRRLVREATTLLLKRIASLRQGGEQPSQRRIEIEPHFVVRESVGAAPSPAEFRNRLHML